MAEPLLPRRWKRSVLIEVNAHSLFSKWFSESGKLVAALFKRIQQQLADGAALVFILIDEVESLTAARQAAMDSGEPADSIRFGRCVPWQSQVPGPVLGS